jgi:hypothetical protein
MAEEVLSQGILILPVISLGIILGLYELFAIHADMNFRGSHWFGHGLHAVAFMMVTLFIVLNINYFYEIAGVMNWGLPAWVTNPWVFRAIVGLILNIKMHATSSLARGGSGLAARGLAEHWTHTTLISCCFTIILAYSSIIPASMGGRNWR